MGKGNVGEAKIMEQYLNDVAKFPVIRDQEEERYIGYWAKYGNLPMRREAQEELVKRNLLYVVYEAKRYSKQGVTLVDLISVGNIGLMKAAERFDYELIVENPETGKVGPVKFASYARFWIRQSCIAEVARQGKSVSIPVSVASEVNKVRKAQNALINQGHRRDYALDRALEEVYTPETTQRTGEKLETFRERRRHAISAARNISNEIELNAPVRYGEDTGRAEVLAIPDQNHVEYNSMREDLESALQKLNAREAKVLRLYFGLEDGEHRTLEEIGSIFGVTRERTRQIRDKALHRLRTNPDVLRILDPHIYDIGNS
jgi:RNA polymerase primary sigma factor